MSNVTLTSMQNPRSSDTTIIEYADQDRSAWNEYVQRNPAATFFHRADWRDLLQDYFGYECTYLIARSGGSITGVLPLVHFRNVLAGNALISLPFLVRGGPVADDDGTERALVSRALDIAHDRGVDYLELRNTRPVAGDLISKDLYVNFRREIHADSDANLKAIPRKQRAVVRKGIESDLEVSLQPDVDRFYAIFCESYRNLGTPVFGRGLFSRLLETFGDDCGMLTVSRAGRPLASVMSFYHNREVIPYYGGGRAEARGARANDYMYWALMDDAARRGMRWFDYGRSKRNTGSFSFKKNWGFEPEPLHYQYALIKATKLPNLSPSNPKFDLAIRIWRRLPLPMTRMIGPLVAHRVG